MEHKPAKAVAAAVTAAVLSYIKLQEESSKPQAAVALPSASATDASGASLYSASVRQQMMEMRRLLSLRMGRR